MSQNVSVLENFGLSYEIPSGVLQAVWGVDAAEIASPSENLFRWLQLLPAAISKQIEIAVNQERPFMPADVTPEMMAMPNENVPSMNHIEIIYRCIDFALRADNYTVAAALVYVVDRACYRYGRSAALLRVVEEITRLSSDTPIAPQVILRQARVMKDGGDLHTAMRVLDDVISRERKWDYKTQEQYENTKAVCVQIKGQILHNLGLWKEAVAPLVESIHSFNIVQDKKGTSSSLGLLSRCLKKLGAEDYQELQNRIDVFHYPHPCYEAYVKGLEAVQLIEDLGTTVYVTHNQLVADESLLMFTIQQHNMTERQKLDQFRVIVKEMIHSLAGHRTVHYLQSLEVFVVFVRAVFMINLTLAFSPIRQDTDLARFLEKLSLELYGYMCQQLTGEEGPASPSLTQSSYSVRLMNSALALLGLPALEGSSEVERKEIETKWSEAERKGGENEQSLVEQNDLPQDVSTSSLSGALQSQDTSISLPSSESSLSSSTHSFSSPQSVTGSAPSRNDKQLGSNHSQLKTKSQTFPATVKPQLSRHGRGRRSTDNKLNQKYVGLKMSKEDLQAATCPTLDDGAILDDKGQDEDEKDRVDLDSLLVSAQTFASLSAKESGKHDAETESASSAPTDLSAGCRKSGSSAAADLCSAGDRKSGSQGSWTVDPSASTQSTSSATTESSDDCSNNNGLKLYGSEKKDAGLSSPGSCDSSPCQGSRERAAAPVSPGSSFKEMSSSSMTVDPFAETEPSTPSDTTDLGDGALLSPLVDVSSACALMSDLHLGDSVDTNSSSEFLANFAPSDSKDVHRAVLFTYNPVDGAWSAQTTLAYLGPLLNIVTKGANRDTFHVSFLHQDEPLGRYVGKRYRRGRKSPQVYMQDVVCQMLAGFYVTRFNQALQHCLEAILQVQFLSAAHLQLFSADGKVFDWINVEPFLHGSFIKLTNNLHFVNKAEKNEKGVEVVTALSHFSYVETGGTLMIVDIQGWTPADGKGVVYLTDPVFHTLNMREFSSGDRHKEGMDAFWANQHPVCNRICQYLGLDKKRPHADTDSKS